MANERVSITINTKELLGLIKVDGSTNASKAVRAQFKGAQAAIRNRAEDLAPRHQDSTEGRYGSVRGRPLKDSIRERDTPGRVSVGGVGRGASFLVSAEGRKAVFVIRGVKPHRIRPKPTLRFRWSKLSGGYGPGGNVLVAYSPKFRLQSDGRGGAIRHPGSKPNDFLLQALNEVLPRYFPGARTRGIRFTQPSAGD